MGNFYGYLNSVYENGELVTSTANTWSEEFK